MMNSSTNPNRGLSALEDFTTDMEKVFDSLLGRTVGSVLRSNGSQKYVPSLDISETENDYQVSVDLPGVNPDDVKVEMHDGRLTVSGAREVVKEEKEKNYHRIERSSGSFTRAISIPNEVDVDKIDASYEHGVLHIVLPKTQKQQPKKIQIRTGNSE